MKAGRTIILFLSSTWAAPTNKHLFCRALLAINCIAGANWSPSQKALVERFTNDLGGSAWLNMDSTYYDEDGPTSINVSVGTVVSVPDYSYGQDLSDWDVAGLFSDAINSGALPLSANAIYAVLTDDTVKQHDDYGSSFGEVYCGWHSNGIWSEDDGSTFDLKWLWVGNALSMYPDNCISYSMRVTYGPPNGDAGIDGMLSVIAHEIAEAMTDPDLLGWRDAALWVGSSHGSPVCLTDFYRSSLFHWIPHCSAQLLL